MYNVGSSDLYLLKLNIRIAHAHDSARKSLLLHAVHFLFLAVMADRHAHGAESKGTFKLLLSTRFMIPNFN